MATTKIQPRLNRRELDVRLRARVENRILPSTEEATLRQLGCADGDLSADNETSRSGEIPNGASHRAAVTVVGPVVLVHPTVWNAVDDRAEKPDRQAIHNRQLRSRKLSIGDALTEHHEDAPRGGAKRIRVHARNERR